MLSMGGSLAVLERQYRRQIEWSTTLTHLLGLVRELRDRKAAGAEMADLAAKVIAALDPPGKTKAAP